MSLQPNLAFSAKATDFMKQMEARSAVYELDAEQAIYVDIPQQAMEFDQMIKTHVLLQPQLTTEIEERYRKLLYFTPDNLPDMDKVIEGLKMGPDQFILLEEFMRQKIKSVMLCYNVVMRWTYLTSTHKGCEDNIESIHNAMSQIEETATTVLDNIVQYHQMRGKLMAKLVKRRLYDVAKTLAQFDIAQSNDMRNAFVDLYNCIISAYDVCVKYFEIAKMGKQQQAIGGYQNMF